MATTNPDATRLAHYVQRHLDMSAARLGEEYYYQSLPLCIIDAVFSIGVRYTGVQKIVARYCTYTNQRRVRESSALPLVWEQESVSEFCSRSEQPDPLFMAVSVYGSRQRTSTQNGILKAEAVLRFANCLRSRGVEYFQHLARVESDEALEADIRSIPGQGSGISLQYFWMLAGSDQLIKPDRMVIRFLGKAIGRAIGVQEALPLLQGANALLLSSYPTMTPRLLDHEIWKHERGGGCEPLPKNS